MKSRAKSVFCTIILSFLLFLLNSNFVFALEIEKYPALPRMPGLADGANLGDLVSYFFSLLILVAGILAAIYLTLGGIKIITSIGNPSARKDALDMVKSALLGMLLLVSSYMILNTINPKFLSPYLSSLPAGDGIYYSNGSNKLPALIREANTANVPQGYGNILYECSTGPDLYIWKFPKINFKGSDDKYQGVSVGQIACGESVSLSGIKSFELAFKKPGIYYFLEENCSGHMSYAMIGGGQLQAPFKNNVKSIRIINNPTKEYFGVIFHGTSHPSFCDDDPQVCNDNPSSCDDPPECKNASFCSQRPSFCSAFCNDSTRLCNDPSSCDDPPGCGSSVVCDDNPALCDDDKIICNDNPLFCDDDPSVCDDPVSCDDPSWCSYYYDSSVCNDDPWICNDPYTCDDNPSICNDDSKKCNDNPKDCNDDKAKCDDDPTEAGPCSWPIFITDLNKKEECFNGTDVSSSATFFDWNPTTPASSGTGISFYSEPWGNLVGSRSGECSLSNTTVGNYWFGPQKTTCPQGMKPEDCLKEKCAKTLDFSIFWGKRPTQYKNVALSFLKRPGSIYINGDYLVAVYDKNRQCQVFRKNVINFKETDFYSTVPSVDYVFIAPIK